MRKLLLGQFRLLYSADRWMRRRFTPAGLTVLVAFLAAAVFGINIRQTLSYQIATLCLAMLLIAIGGAALFRARFDATRRLPRYATVDLPMSYAVELRSKAARPQAGLELLEDLAVSPPSFAEFANHREPGYARRNWFDRSVGYPRWVWLMRRRQGASLDVTPLPLLPAGGRVEVQVRLTPIRRGYVRFEGLTLARPDPLGLFRAFSRVRRPDAMLVLPKRYRVDWVELEGSRALRRGGDTVAESVGDSEEFALLREYRPGDPMRYIHWRSWARHGEPVVKEFQAECFVRLGLVLDTFLGERELDVFEEAVSVAASFACDAAPRDGLLDLLFVGPEAYQVSSGPGVGTTERLLEILACVESCTDRPFDVLREAVCARVDQLTGCVCVLLAWDQPRRDFVATLCRAGLPVLVLVVVPAGADTALDPGPLTGRAAGLRAVPVGDAERVLGTLSRDLAAGGSAHGR